MENIRNYNQAKTNAQDRENGEHSVETCWMKMIILTLDIIADIINRNVTFIGIIQ